MKGFQFSSIPKQSFLLLISPNLTLSTLVEPLFLHPYLTAFVMLMGSVDKKVQMSFNLSNSSCLRLSGLSLSDSGNLCIITLNLCFSISFSSFTVI